MLKINLISLSKPETKFGLNQKPEIWFKTRN